MSWLLLGLLACGPKDTDSTASVTSTGSTSLPADPVEAFRVLADREGFDVREGSFDFFDHETCCIEQRNCLWNNPSTPYGIYALPELPEQTGINGMPFGDGLGRSFHLREDEVLVLLGPTPPPAKYFSQRSYITWRFSTTPDQLLIASLGPSLNHLVIGEQLGGSPFSRDIAVVTSADAGIEQAIHGLLEQAGWAADAIFDDRMAHARAQFGLGPEADQFTAVTRLAVVEDEAQRQAYYADNGTTLLRLTPRSPIHLTAPHGDPVLPDRGTGTDESAWAAALDELGAAILARYTEHDPVEILANHWWFETLDCIDDGHCSFDIRDRYYSRSPNFTLPDDQHFAIAYGVNHERTGKASYSNVAADTVDLAIGLDAVNSVQMIGTAREYLPDHPLVDDLFAVTVARDCTGLPQPCMAVPYDCPGVPANDPMLVSFRAYLEPETAAAPIEGELLADRVIRYTPKATTP